LIKQRYRASNTTNSAVSATASMADGGSANHGQYIVGALLEALGSGLRLGLRLHRVYMCLQHGGWIAAPLAKPAGELNKQTKQGLFTAGGERETEHCRKIKKDILFIEIHSLWLSDPKKLRTCADSKSSSS
jgi:hypothetical protein